MLHGCGFVKHVLIVTLFCTFVHKPVKIKTHPAGARNPPVLHVWALSDFSPGFDATVMWFGVSCNVMLCCAVL
jgi:hypothetical protein